METEFEAKFYPVNKDEYRNKLLSMGAKILHAERKMTRIIGDARVNKFSHRNDYIRIRDEGDVVRLSFKRTADTDGNLSDQKEVDVIVSDFEKTIDILKLAGIKFTNRQETLREEWEYKGANVTIDTWPGLLPYSEIETSSEEKVKELALELGLNWETKMITAAPEVFQKVYGLGIEEVLKRISNLTFENNPFEGLTKAWNGE